MLLLIATLACPPPDTGVEEDSEPPILEATLQPPLPVDRDGDGYPVTDGDCNDQDPEVHPRRSDDCNGYDDNCDGRIDEGYSDLDEDGTADCVDTEECDGLDNDGDGEIDEGAPDTDGDGLPDCVDVELCNGDDDDGDGEIDEGFDGDGDGWAECDDCDDGDASRAPDAEELPGTGVDEDCDGQIDEGAWAPGDLVITEVMVNPWDVADPKGEWVEVLNASDRIIHLDGLTVLTDALTHLIAPETPVLLQPGDLALLGPNGDTSTNGEVAIDHVVTGLTLLNEGGWIALQVDGVDLDTVTWDASAPDGASLALDPHHLSAEDNDDDGYWCPGLATWGPHEDLGTPGADNPLCPTVDHDFDGYAEADGDCNEDDPSIHPGMEETWYDGIDSDCDGWSDDDADFDGHDAEEQGGTDCDDDKAGVNPDQPEVCNGVDDDCDGSTDGPAAIDAKTWFTDSDSDGYGDSDDATVSCRTIPGAVIIPNDCDDTNAAVNPGEAEVCGDGIDNDCDSDSGCGMEGFGSLADADVALRGSSRSESVGYSVGAGDWNGDGTRDLVIGAPGSGSRGVAYLVEGPPTSGFLSTLGQSWSGGSRGSDFGTAVTGVGDVDGDGYDDLLVGANTAAGMSSSAGAAYLVTSGGTGTSDLGSVGVMLGGSYNNDEAGYAVAGAGDVDGDGLADLLVGAPTADKGGSSSGEAYLVLAPVESTFDLSSADAVLVGVSSNDRAGHSVDTAGDIDGDGLPDLLIGALYGTGSSNDSGAAYAVSGLTTGQLDLSSATAVLGGDQRNDQAGSCVAGLGDVDGDGWDDVAVGAPGSATAGSSSGVAYIVYGPLTGNMDLLDADGTWTGESSSSIAGVGLAGAGDLDGDGVDDVLVGSYGHDTPNSNTGAAYVLYGGAE